MGLGKILDQINFESNPDNCLDTKNIYITYLLSFHPIVSILFSRKEIIPNYSKVFFYFNPLSFWFCLTKVLCK